MEKLNFEYSEFIKLVARVRGKEIDQYEISKPHAGRDGRLNLKAAALQIVDVLAANNVNFNQIGMVFDAAKHSAGVVTPVASTSPESQPNEKQPGLL